MADSDTRFMRMAVTLSRRGLGATAENPPVGCILVKENRVVGRGVTASGGRPHAETIALSQAGEQSNGATAYVTLEPCAHTGKTPPCSTALIEAGIARVVCAVDDPDHRVSGKGLTQLVKHNIAVSHSVCTRGASQVLAGYLSRTTTSRPRVLLKLAISQDEMLATNNSDERWITGALARRRGHLMRSQCDAIVVGIGTVLADDPDLTCRLKGLEGRSPLRVIVDTNLRTPINSRLVKSARKTPVMIACAVDVAKEQVRKYWNLGVKILPCGVKNGRIDLEILLEKLAELGINRALFEGGAGIALALINGRLVDELAIFMAPRKIGLQGSPAFTDLTLSSVIETLSLVEDYKLDIGGDQLSLYHRPVAG